MGNKGKNKKNAQRRLKGMPVNIEASVTSLWLDHCQGMRSEGRMALESLAEARHNSSYVLVISFYEIRIFIDFFLKQRP